MLVQVAFAHGSSRVLHSGEPTYDGEPVVVQLARVHKVDLQTRYATVQDQDGDVGFVHLSRLYNVYAEDDGALELASWAAP